MPRSSPRTPRATHDNRVYDRTGLDRRVVGWFVAGLLVALFVQSMQVRAIGGGVDGLLSVGEESPMRPLIENVMMFRTCGPGTRTFDWPDHYRTTPAPPPEPARGR